MSRGVGRHPIRVLVVDDTPVELTGASAVLDGAEDIVVVGRCSRGDEVVEMAARLRSELYGAVVCGSERNGRSAVGMLVG